MATNTVGVNMEMGCERCQARWESTQIRDPLAALAPRFWYLFIMFANNKLYTEQQPLTFCLDVTARNVTSDCGWGNTKWSRL